jgi:hypothetical protein
VRKVYLIIAVEFFTDLGNGFISLTLLGLLVFEQTDSLSNLVWLRMVEQAPSIILSPFFLFLADRIGAERWLAGALISKCILAVVLIFAIFQEAVIAAYFFFISASLFYALGRLAIIPFLVPENQIFSFNALNEQVAIAGGIAHPFLVAWTIAKIGRNSALGVAVFLFLTASCGVLMLRKRTAKIKNVAGGYDPDNGHLFSISKDLFKATYNLRTYFILTGFVLLGGGVLNFSLPLLFKDRFGGNISQWGFLMSLYQAGAFLSTLLIHYITTLGIRRVLVVNFVALSGTMAILGKLTPPFPISWLMILFGCGFTFMHVIFESLIQKNSPAPHVGKIVLALLVLRGVGYLGGTLGSVLVLKFLDMSFLLLIGATLFLVASMLVNPRSFSCHSDVHPENSS